MSPDTTSPIANIPLDTTSPIVNMSLDTTSPIVNMSLDTTSPIVNMSLDTTSPMASFPPTETTTSHGMVKQKNINRKVLHQSGPGVSAIETGGVHKPNLADHIPLNSMKSDLDNRVLEYYKNHYRPLDPSLEGKSSEELVSYLVETRGFKEEEARDLVKIFLPGSLSKLVKLPQGVPTIAERRAWHYEGWE